MYICQSQSPNCNWKFIPLNLPHLVLKRFYFTLSIIDLQFCVSFRCTAKGFSYICVILPDLAIFRMCCTSIKIFIKTHTHTHNDQCFSNLKVHTSQLGILLKYKILTLLALGRTWESALLETGIFRIFPYRDPEESVPGPSWPVVKESVCRNVNLECY